MTACPVDNSSLRTTSELIQGLIIRGKYEILEKIGTGGMAAVYRARHQHFDEVRAIKVVRSWMADDEAFLRRLRSEAVISRKLQHPNAVRVDDLDTLEDGRPFIVMEYVEGPDLRKVIQNTGPMPASRVINIASQVAAALGAAHKLRIIHRDIKPDNIRLVQSPDGSELVKVLDFGIAKVQGAAAQTGAGSLTMTGMLVCTPDYASPEQAHGGSSSMLDGRSDLYSLGIVMYEMLTGELPFHSDTPMGMLLAHITTKPRSLSDFKPELAVSEDMSALLMKCLEKDPNDRFQTADELLDALEQIDSGAVVRAPAARGRVLAMPKGVPITASTPPPAPPIEEPSPETTHELTAELRLAEHRRRMATRGLFVLALVIVLAALAFLVRSQWSRPQVTAAPTTSTVPPDPAVLADVKHAITKIKGAQKIVASISGGEVRLSGEASSQEVLDKAALQAARVSGVASVDKSGVNVASPPPPPPAVPLSATQPANAQNTALPGVQPPSAAGNGPSASPDPQPPATATAPTTVAQKYRENPEVEQLLAKARQERDQTQFDKALADCEAALRLDPRSPAARNEKRITLNAKHWFDTNNQ